MLKFSISTNWDDNLIKGIDSLDSGHKVTELFGKLASDFVGGGRPSYAVPFVSKRHASGHIKLIKGTGRKFNYLLNASCLDNREFTRSGQRQIRKLLSWLESLGVDAITVTNPYLATLIKKEYPRFELAVSRFASLTSLRQIKFWTEEIGADKITLPDFRINRNFPLLKKIRSEVNCELQLIANQFCLSDCPLGSYHANFSAHASQIRHPLWGFGIDWCMINCRHKLLTQPEEFIKASWIRPEDVGYYESIGIDSLKITDRAWDTQSILYPLKAYLERKFEGNLADLIIRRNKLSKKQLLLTGAKFFFHPFHINIFKLRKFSGLSSDIAIYVDNRKLDGFLDYFFEGKCKFDDCKECSYCKDVAERIVHIDQEHKERIEKNFSELIESLIKGDIFRYF